MKRYILHPGHVKSINDGTWHYIGAKQLADLYRVPFNECEICDSSEDFDHVFTGLHRDRHTGSGVIHLYPQRNGNYSIPAEAYASDQELVRKTRLRN